MHKATHRNSSDIVPPRIACSYCEEPSLAFGAGREHVCPKTGIILFGPRFLDSDERHPVKTKLGIIGTGKSIASAGAWIDSCLPGVDGDATNESFPGYQEDRGFFSKIVMDTAWQEIITRHELAAVARPRHKRERFEEAVGIVSDKIRLLAQKEQEPDVIILALPDELLQHCKTVDFRDPERGLVHRDFRRAIKAEAMKYRIPTQILLQRTSEATPESRNVDHKARCAWNFFICLHYKAGGMPWGPKSLTPGTCYVGISFSRPLGNVSSTVRTSIAQAFDEHGEGIVLRGRDFHWNEAEGGKSPHLNEHQAVELVNAVIKRYEDEMKQKPSRVVVHKTSRFWPEEEIGFEKALQSVNRFDLVAVAPQSKIRLLRSAKYPVLRGTAFSIGDLHFLYTTGFLPSMRAYPHGHVPAPLQIADHIGDSSIGTITEEILALTKLNWNSAAFGGLLPITLKFSRFVGDIMREVPSDREPLPQFKFYI